MNIIGTYKGETIIILGFIRSEYVTCAVGFFVGSNGQLIEFPITEIQITAVQR